MNQSQITACKADLCRFQRVSPASKAKERYDERAVAQVHVRLQFADETHTHKTCILPPSSHVDKGQASPPSSGAAASPRKSEYLFIEH